MAIKIKAVQSTEDLEAFVKFAHELYHKNPYYVPKLQRDELNLLNPEVNPAFEHCEAKYFLAFKDDKIVGRIAGIINYQANDTWNQKTVRFGFLDFINDEKVVDLLFDAVEEWAISKGMNTLHGPMGFSDFDEKGVLIEGFDQLGTASTIFNYAYYAQHLERRGFLKDLKWKEYKIEIPKELPKAHQEIVKEIKEKYGLKILKLKSKQEVSLYAHRIFETLNKCYATEYGYSELNEEQIDFYAKRYTALLRLNFISLVIREEDNKIIAVAITMPSLSKALKKADGSLFPFGWAHLMKAQRSKSNDVVDINIMGVLPEFQNKGITALLYEDLCQEYNKNNIRYAESLPELELSTAVQLQWNLFKRTHHKTRRTYIKKID